MNAEDDAVEDYLDDLLPALRGTPREIRRMLAETEGHLHDAIAEDVARGIPPEAAARAAVARFGRASDVARAWNAATPPLPLRAVVLRLGGQFLPLVAVGCIAIGASGLAARVMTAVGGRTFMFAGPPGTIYPAADCRHWLALHPAAGSCTAAYLAESQSDDLLARYAVGILGVALLLAVVLLSRHRPPLVTGQAILASFTGALAFALAGLGLLALGVDAIRTSDSHGAGQWLSGAVIALPLACVYGYAFLRAARRSPGSSPGRRVADLQF